MTESDKELIINLWENGNTVAQIIQMLPYDELTAKKMIKQLKLENVLEKRYKYKGATREKILNAYNSGMTNPYELAETYGLAVGTVKNILYELKIIKSRNKKNYKERNIASFDSLCERSKNIVEALKDGHSVSKIAQMYGVSRQWVYSLKNVQIKRIKRRKY